MPVSKRILQEKENVSGLFQRSESRPKKLIIILLNKKNGLLNIKAHLSGIKNSWKYEKDLIILNAKQISGTIRQPGNILQKAPHFRCRSGLLRPVNGLPFRLCTVPAMCGAGALAPRVKRVTHFACAKRSTLCCGAH